MADPSPERTLRSAFAVFDGDGDGTISNQEMKRVMRNLGEPVTNEDMNAVMHQFDAVRAAPSTILNSLSP
eukprot:CAMPEP_0174694050 /NCGR_PEP_ID=MMETSP1094-20130205/685_1 /TAXON_ID=156173 /ORGANISM="Chrysochromulina brevifilum, Strain UTEX LB 985" /LENGTH=69 /DNA_ID=CAMNT_0015890165 /DNA_START=98 /DNA_END=307 /DNA_ORIENTATION=+